MVNVSPGVNIARSVCLTREGLSALPAVCVCVCVYECVRAVMQVRQDNTPTPFFTGDGRSECRQSDAAGGFHRLAARRHTLGR